MHRLLLLRHAKSSWDDPSLADLDRPLAPRGRLAAERMAGHLRSDVPHPDLVLCSPALRTRETLERMSNAFGDAEVVVDDELYGAGGDELLERLRAVDDRFETVAVIGHNPGIHDLAITLAGSGAERDRMRAKFPTGALAVLAFDGPWRDVSPADGRLEAFVTPRISGERRPRDSAERPTVGRSVHAVSFGAMHADELRAAITEGHPRSIEELSNLVRIPSIAFPGYDGKPVRESAEATAETLEAAGYGGVRLIELPDVDHPAVFGEVAGPTGAPTILLYAHHDVQPEGPHEQWTSPPFEPEVRDGRLYGRGTSDDKCGIVMHAAAMRAWEGEPPVTVKVLVEGEEEASAEHLPFLIGGHRELLVADVIGVADGGNWRAGIPTLETSIRGVVDCIVTVRTLDLAVHSGSYGGPAIDAISALARILSTLHDDDGQVAIEGLTHGPWEGLQLTEEEYREDTPLRPSVSLVGSGSISERLWSKPAVAVLGLDAPRVIEASNQLVPVASAKVSLRLAPEDDAQRAMELLTGHLAKVAPWGVEVDVAPGTSGQGMRVRTDGPGFAAMDRALQAAFGRPVVQSGSGGSVPLVPELSSALPDAEILLYGAADEKSQYHSTDESVDLGELERSCLAEALLFGELAKG